MQWKPITKISKSVVKSEFHLLACCPLCLCIMETLKKLTANPNKKQQSLLIYNATVVEPALLSPPAAVRLGLAKAPQGL